jgi:hypothetical protein
MVIVKYFAFIIALVFLLCLSVSEVQADLLTIESDSHHLGDNNNVGWAPEAPEGASFSTTFNLDNLNFKNSYISIDVYGFDKASHYIIINSSGQLEIPGDTGDYWHTETININKSILNIGSNSISVYTTGSLDDIMFRSLALGKTDLLNSVLKLGALFLLGIGLAGLVLLAMSR